MTNSLRRTTRFGCSVSNAKCFFTVLSSKSYTEIHQLDEDQCARAIEIELICTLSCFSLNPCSNLNLHIHMRLVNTNGGYMSDLVCCCEEMKLFR